MINYSFKNIMTIECEIPSWEKIATKLYTDYTVDYTDSINHIQNE